MKLHPIDLVYNKLTHIVTPYMTDSEHIKDRCSCCKRSASEFNYEGYKFKNGYQQSVMHCPQCQSFFASAPDILGIESPKRPTTSQKFGMWPGVGALINVNDLSAVLLAPPGVVKKIPPAFLNKVNVITATVGEHAPYLLNTGLRFPLIYIRDFGRKTYCRTRTASSRRGRITASPKMRNTCTATMSTAG